MDESAEHRVLRERFISGEISIEEYELRVEAHLPPRPLVTELRTARSATRGPRGRARGLVLASLAVLACAGGIVGVGAYGRGILAEGTPVATGVEASPPDYGRDRSGRPIPAPPAGAEEDWIYDPSRGVWFDPLPNSSPGRAREMRPQPQIPQPRP